MDIQAAFPGKFIKAADLSDKPKMIKIEFVSMEAVGNEGDTKPVIRWPGSDQGFVLNKTNSMEIASIHGNETADWIGQEIEIYPTKTQFGTKVMDCIRVRAPGTAALDEIGI